MSESRAHGDPRFARRWANRPGPGAVARVEIRRSGERPERQKPAAHCGRRDANRLRLGGAGPDRYFRELVNRGAVPSEKPCTMLRRARAHLSGSGPAAERRAPGADLIPPPATTGASTRRGARSPATNKPSLGSRRSHMVVSASGILAHPKEHDPRGIIRFRPEDHFRPSRGSEPGHADFDVPIPPHGGVEVQAQIRAAIIPRVYLFPYFGPVLTPRAVVAVDGHLQ